MMLENIGIIEIPISELKKIPRYVTSHSSILINEIAKKKPSLEDIGPIHIGIVNKDNFVIDGRFKLAIAKQSGYNTILAFTKNYKKMGEMMIEHVKRNKQNLNPLKLFTMFEMLKQRGYSEEQINSLTELDKTPYVNLIRKVSLDEDQITRFAEYVELLIEEHYTITIPDYIFTKWQTVPRKKQRQYITELMKFTRPLSVKHFSWPSFRELTSIIKPIIDSSDNESQVTIATKVKSEKLFTEGNNCIIVKKSSREIIKNIPNEITYSLEMFKDAVFIPSQRQRQPGIIINLKTMNYVTLKEFGGLLQCNSENSQPVIVMPMDNMEVDDKIYIKKGTVQEIRKALKFMSSKDQFSIISSKQFNIHA